MATLALSVAGAGLGSLTGLGAGTGWFLGNTLGRIFFPAQTNKGGSRLSDLKISGASYGAAIPTLFGTMRMGGNVLWAAPLMSKEKSTATGGKGSVSRSEGQTAYEYFASFALGLARGEVGELLKIWADGTPIYDATSAGEIRVPDLNFRFYKGDQTQLPDSIIEADLGVGEVPAYRGLSYLVFDMLPLGPYGNRLPNIEVLLSTEGIKHFPHTLGEEGYLDTSSVAYDELRRHLYTYEVTGGVNKVRKIDFETLRILQEADIGSEFPQLSSSTDGFSLDRNGDFWIGSGFGLLAGRKISRFNSRAMLTEKDRMLPAGVGAVTYSTDILSTLTGSLFQVAGSQQNGQVVVFDADLDVVDLINAQCLACTGALSDETETAWIALSGLAAVNPVSDLQIVQLSLTAVQTYGGVAYGQQHTLHDISRAQLTPLGGDFPEVNTITRLVGYLKSPRELVLQNDYRLFKWSMDRQSITAKRDENGLGEVSLTNTNTGEQLVYVSGGQWLVYLNAENLEEVARVDLHAFENVSSVAQSVYDAASDSLVVLDPSGLLTRLYLRRQSGTEAEIQHILETLAVKAGIAMVDVDASEVSGTVPGYILNRPMSIRDALDPLMIAGYLDVAESGYRLKFFPKKNSPDVTLLEKDLLSPVHHQRLQESEMPGSVTLSYMAADGGHLAGTQSAKRSYRPKATMSGRNEMTLDLPLSLEAGAAKAIVQQSLYSSWSERQGISGSLPLQYLALDAADVIRLVTDNQQVDGRLIQQYLGADYSLEFDAVQIASNGGAPGVSADRGTGYSQVLIQRPSYAELFILDLPLLKDEDATAGVASRYYVAMDGYGQNWRGAGLYVSDTGERYEQRGVLEATMCWGAAMTVLGAAGSAWQTDRVNRLTIRFLNGGERLESVSEKSALNGANALLVGDEIINFSGLTQNGDGSYEIDTLLRGRRGTEGAMSTHKVGDRVLLLEADRLFAAVMALGSLNLPHYFKAVGAGQLLEDVPAQIKKLKGRDLQPYAPVHVSSHRMGNDLTLSWERRSRLGATSLSHVAPLAEKLERYELCFSYDGDIVHKHVTEETRFLYGLSEFNDDFSQTLAAIPTLSLTLYQVSEVIGRGHPAQEFI